MNSLSEILQEVISAAAARDWEKVESAAENLKVWARAAARAKIDPGANEHPGNGDGR